MAAFTTMALIGLSAYVAGSAAKKLKDRNKGTPPPANVGDTGIVPPITAPMPGSGLPTPPDTGASASAAIRQATGAATRTRRRASVAIAGAAGAKPPVLGTPVAGSSARLVPKTLLGA